MSDHLCGSEQYYLEHIDMSTDATLSEVHGIKDAVNRMEKVNESLDRVLDGIRELLNIENEALAFVREIRKQRDLDAIEKREREMTIVFADLFTIANNIEHFRQYLLGRDSYALNKLEACLTRVSMQVTKEIQERDKAKENTARLIREDTKQW